jgi:uncharacterized protein (DUF1499 family)
MRRGIPIRRSRAAGWARLCGGLALPVLALGVVGMRSGIVPQVALEPVLIVGFVLGLAALGLGLYSLADIWNSGAEGARTAIAGLVYAAPVLVILGLVAAAAIAYPRLTDVATDVDDPPMFTAPGAPKSVPDTSRAAIQRDAYPEIVPHHYPLPLGEVYLAVRHIVDTRRWMVTSDVHPTELPGDATAAAPGQAVAEDDEVILALSLKSVMTQSRSGAATETQPRAGEIVIPPPPVSEAAVPDNEATIEALAPTPVFGFLDDVVLRLRVTPDGTAVDMRSASRVGEHDLGQNARRISSFMAELDSVLQPDPAAAATR